MVSRTLTRDIISKYEKEKKTNRKFAGIVQKGVCLGRAPGFRRKDVDMAFKASVLEAY